MRNYCCVLLVAALFLAGCTKSPQEHMRLAREYMAKKELRKAVVEYKIASQNLPNDAEPLYQLALIYREAGAGALAIETLQRAIKINPRHEGAQRELAIVQVGSDHAEAVEEAAQVLRRLVESHPKDAEAIGILALAEAKLKHPAEARQRLDMALKLDPKNIRPATLLVARYAAQGELEAARDISRAVEAQSPNSPEAALLAAQVAAAGKDLPGAEIQLQRALAIKPDFGPALEMMVRKKLYERDMPGAEQAARSLSRLPDKQWWTVYGRILFGQKKLDLATAEFDRLLAEHPAESELRNEYSGLLYGAGRRKEASAIIAGTLKKNPSDGGALLQRTAMALDTGDLETASRDIKRLRELKMTSAALSYQESRVFAARGESVPQGNALSEALRLSPQMLRARLDLSRLLVGSGKAKNALVILDEASPMEKNSADFIFHRNAALMADGNWAEARKDVDAALALARVPGFLYQDAMLRAREQDLAGARKSLDAARAMSPADASVLGLLGDVMRRQGEGSRYLSLLRETAAKFPANSAIQMMLGNNLLGQRDRAGARVAFDAARAAGDMAQADLAIALLEMEDGAVPQARQRLLDLAKAHDSAAAQLLLAQIEARPGGSADTALQHYLQALKLEPNNVIGLNNLANHLAQMGKLDDARFWAEKALVQAPSNPVIEDTVGWIYYRQGQAAAALPHLQKSLSLMERPTAHYHLAAALMKTGQTEQARREYDLAVQQAPQAPERAALAPLFGR